MEGLHNSKEKNKTEQWEELVDKVEEFSREDPIPMDEGIKETVVSLMAHKFRTTASCFGHLEEIADSEDMPYPWVAIGGDANLDAQFEDERIEKINTKYFDEAFKDMPLLTGEERNEIKKLQKAVKDSKESERQRLLAKIDEFYSTRNAEPGIRLTVEPLSCWLSSEEVSGVSNDAIREKTSKNKPKVKLEKYRTEMNAFTDFLKVKFFE